MARRVVLCYCCFLAVPLLATAFVAEDDAACSEALLAKEPEEEQAALELLQRRASGSLLPPEAAKQQDVPESGEVQNRSEAMVHHTDPAQHLLGPSAQGSTAASVVAPLSAQVRNPNSASQAQAASPKEQGPGTGSMEQGEMEDTVASGNSTRMPQLFHSAGLAPLAKSNSTGNAEQVPMIDRALSTKEHLRAALAAYALWPSLLAVGLPILVTGFGIVEVSLACSFWLLVRPAVGMLKAAFILSYGLEWAPEQPAGPSLGFVPEAMAASAHFYWAWALGEFVVRLRPLLQRIAAVLLLSILLLPVPLAQVLLGHLGPRQVTANALLGDALGIFFFLFLRLPSNWCLIQALSKATTNGKGIRHPYDNLTGFWGGCSWPAPCRMQQAHKEKSIEAAPDKGTEAPTDETAVSGCGEAALRGSKDSLDEDFVLVCRGAALLELHPQEHDLGASPAG